MIIGVSGPYSADSEEQRKANFDAMNNAAARLLEKGHIPLIGVNVALPIVERADVENKYEAIMTISMAVIDRCEAILILPPESAGVKREKELVQTKGLPVYYSINDIP